MGVALSSNPRKYKQLKWSYPDAVNVSITFYHLSVWRWNSNVPLALRVWQYGPEGGGGVFSLPNIDKFM